MQKWTDRCLIVLFAGLIGVPALMSFVQGPDVASLARENRRPADFPVVSSKTDTLRRFPTRFENWFNDRLPLRDTFLQWHAHWKVGALGVSSSDKVIIGREGWLFLDEVKANATTRSLNAQDQAERWRRALCQRRDWLAERGIAFLVVFAPEKHEVYPEFLPAALQHPRPETAVEVLLRDPSDLPIIDLRPALMSAKSERSLYLQTDTHWNDEGAYVAYREVMERLAARWPQLQARQREDFEIVPERHQGDLVQMLHHADLPAETTTRLVLRSRRAQRLPDVVPLDPQLHSPQYLPPQAWGRPGTTCPRAVILHDSFGERLWLPLLAEHFSVLTYVPTASFVPDVIVQFRPQVVIQQIVARKINWHVPIHPRGF